MSHLLPVLWVEDSAAIMAHDENGALVGFCIMDNWTDTSVQCHFYIGSWVVLRHQFLEVCFEYMFTVRDRKMIYGLVPGDNKLALHFNDHLGFTEKCRFEGAYGEGVDYVILELKKENCMFLEEGIEERLHG